MKKSQENLLIFAWIVALVATLGSLYFSEVLMYVPCKLCWFQRILMYPMVIILAVGIFVKDAKTAYYSLIFSLIGFLLSSYHYSLQKIAALQESAPACGQVSCVSSYINWFGFVTIPFLAGLAFLIILITSITVLKKSKEA